MSFCIKKYLVFSLRKSNNTKYYRTTLASFLYWELFFCVFKKIDLLEYLKDYFCYTGTVFNERLK